MKKPVLMDGAVGTSLWAKADGRGIKKDPVWTYNITHPELVTELTKDYLEAGAKMILANTFGANGPAVKRSSSFSPDEVVRAGVRLVRRVLEGTGIKTVLSAGPLTMLLEPYGDLTEEEAHEIYRAMLGAGMEEKPDMILLQTFMDVEMMRIAAEEAKAFGVPVFCTMTFEKVGKTMMGNSVEQVIETLTPVGVDALGMNCSLGPDLALPIIREFAQKTDLPVVFKPNAGKPILSDGGETAAYDADTFVKDVIPALDCVDYIGGCCGCDASYIRALKAAMNRME